MQVEKYFKEVFQKVQIISGEVLSEIWEILFSNFGYVCRKLGRYQEVLRYYKQVFVFVLNKVFIFFVLGFVNSFFGNYYEVIGFFYKVLGIQREDTFSVYMFGEIFEQFILEVYIEVKQDNDISMEMDDRLDEESD